MALPARERDYFPELSLRLVKETEEKFDNPEQRHVEAYLKEQAERGIELSPEFMDRLHIMGMPRFEVSHDDEAGDVEIVTPDRQLTSHLLDAVEIHDLAPDHLKLAALLHDVGKTGPYVEDREGIDPKELSSLRQLIAEMFAVDHNFNPFDTTAEQLLRLAIHARFKRGDYEEISTEKAAEEVEKHAKLLEKYEIDPKVRMIDFYRMHAKWGADILEHETGIPDRERKPAIYHHAVLHGGDYLNPDSEIKIEDRVNSQWLEVIDYYQAAMRRRKDPDHKEILHEIKTKFSKAITEQFTDSDVKKRMLEGLEKARKDINTRYINKVGLPVDPDETLINLSA